MLLVVSNFGDAQVLLGAETIAILGDHATLVFERPGAGNPQTQAKYTDPAGLIRCRKQHHLDPTDFFLHEGLEHVADLDVVEAFEVHTALVALLDLADVVLEASQTGQLAGPEDDPVA